MLNRTIAAFLPIVLATGAFAQQENKPEHEFFQVRAGYQVTVAVRDLPGARFMEFDDKGTLYVSRPDMGDIMAFQDKDGDGVYETTAKFVENVPSVHGMCFHDGWLWYADTGAIHKAKDTNGDLKADENVDVIPTGELPRKGGHWWRSLLVSKDGMYTSIGDSGNISDGVKTEREKIFHFNLEGKEKKLFASGIRNTEKLRFRPGTTEVWGFDHGSDNFGAKVGAGSQPVTDLNPPDELNLYVQDGFYGHPFVVGNRLPRYEYMDKPDIVELCEKTIVPEWCVHAHWAVNGFTFIDPAINDKTKAFPADHNGDVIFCSHGSWNSSQRVGYCVGRVLFDNGHPYGLLKLVSTLEEKNQVVWARPVDAVQAPDGSILFSSDQPGRVYRLKYVGDKSAAAAKK